MYEVGSPLRFVLVLRKNGQFSRRIEIISTNTCAWKLLGVFRQQVNVPARSSVRKSRIVRVVHCVQTSVKTDARYFPCRNSSLKIRHHVTRNRQGRRPGHIPPDSGSVG